MDSRLPGVQLHGPMLAVRGERVPSGAEWVHEVKWDGMRVLAENTANGLRLTSRRGNDVTASFPELTGMATVLAGRDLLLDGEVVALDELNRPSFARLAERIHVARARQAADRAVSNPVTFFIFDLLRLDGRDLTGQPFSRRRRRLERLGLDGKNWRVSPLYDDGESLLAATADQGLEGILSKRRDSPYQPGVRSPHWLKFPHRQRASFVVGGWRYEVDSDRRLGAVLVGDPTPAGLIYRGRVGSGLGGRAGPVVLTRLLPLASTESTFCTEVPRTDAQRVHWVRPELVIDVEALGVTGHERLRQPTFQGIRDDLSPAELMEDPA